MSRDKFRVYTTISNKYVDTGFVTCYAEIGTPDEFSFSFSNNPNYTIEYSTGIVDSKGNNIFEGDILELDGEKFKIIFDKDYLYYIAIGESLTPLQPFNWDRTTVVGTIHDVDISW